MGPIYGKGSTVGKKRKDFLTGTKICLSSDQSFTEMYHKPYLKPASHTHRQDKAGRHLWSLPSPAPCPEQSAGCSGLCPVGF